VEAGLQPREVIIDIGCGTGAAGAAWALETGAEVRGLDISAWAVAEANWTYQILGVRGRARRARLDELRLPSSPSTVLAAFVVNELDATARRRALDDLRAAAAAGHSVVIVEPIARAVAPWWDEWVTAFEALGGHAQDWRFPADLPPLLRDFDKAAGLRHRELTARTLVVGPSRRPNI
jgi:SAM-dependent methyltransferase